MVSLFRGEWEKIAGNRWAVAGLVWIFPVGMLIISLGAILIALLFEEFREFQVTTLGVAQWDEALLSTWTIPNNEVGRIILLAFTSIVFAGEYQYGTWKNLIPRRSRALLILIKFITLAVFITVSYVAASLIAGVGTGLFAGVVGVDYGLANAGAMMGEFLREYTFQMTITLTATLIAAGYAALAAMLTHNILGSLLVGFIMYLAETGSLILIFAADRVLHIDISGLYQLTPGYNLANISSWVTTNRGMNMLDMHPHSLELSLALVVAWVVGMVALTVYLFRRQDIAN